MLIGPYIFFKMSIIASHYYPEIKPIHKSGMKSIGDEIPECPGPSSPWSRHQNYQTALRTWSIGTTQWTGAAAAVGSPQTKEEEQIISANLPIFFRLLDKFPGLRSQDKEGRSYYCCTFINHHKLHVCVVFPFSALKHWLSLQHF